MTAADMRPPSHPDRSAVAMLGLLAIPLLCCGLPALAAAGLLAGAGSWLVAGRSWLLGGAALVAPILLLRRWWVTRRRCRLPEVPSTDTPPTPTHRGHRE